MEVLTWSEIRPAGSKCEWVVLVVVGVGSKCSADNVIYLGLQILSTNEISSIYTQRNNGSMEEREQGLTDRHGETEEMKKKKRNGRRRSCWRAWGTCTPSAAPPPAAAHPRNSNASCNYPYGASALPIDRFLPSSALLLLSPFPISKTLINKVKNDPQLPISLSVSAISKHIQLSFSFS